jgi:hypothetical protein
VTCGGGGVTWTVAEGVVVAVMPVSVEVVVPEVDVPLVVVDGGGGGGGVGGGTVSTVVVLSADQPITPRSG